MQYKRETDAKTANSSIASTDSKSNDSSPEKNVKTIVTRSARKRKG